MLTHHILQKTIKNLIESYLDDDCIKSIEDINNGWCADFATVIWEKHSDVSIWADVELGHPVYTHTFIQFEHLYYDAECVEGVSDWRNLPIYQRQGTP